jgi:hypothetical protein
MLLLQPICGCSSQGLTPIHCTYQMHIMHLAAAAGLLVLVDVWMSLHNSKWPLLWSVMYTVQCGSIGVASEPSDTSASGLVLPDLALSNNPPGC